MKNLFTICIAILCIVTVSGCTVSRNSDDTIGNNDVYINPTTAVAKVSFKNGCEVSELDEDTGGAVLLREWLDGFETTLVESVPEDGRRRYAVELTFGWNEPERCEYLDCGDECYLRRGEEWFSVKNPSSIPIGYVSDLGVGVWDIVNVEYAHNAEITQLDLSEEDKRALSEWLCGLKYERREFPEGETPGDSDGGEAYMFTFETGELSYIDNGGSERFLLFGDKWYAVGDFAEIPLVK